MLSLSPIVPAELIRTGKTPVDGITTLRRRCGYQYEVHERLGRYADVIEKADSLESLAGVVREMVEESRTVQALVQQTQARLHEEHAKASGLTRRVNELETEMRRLSDEVTTDPPPSCCRHGAHRSPRVVAPLSRLQLDALTSDSVTR